ncbi:MAG: type II toxin-antitoxin system VapC family toxin [Acidimicrobiia bacterium]
MTFLLDTHVLLWLVGAPDRVPAEVRDTLSDPAHRLGVSAVSALEVATKQRLGKLAVGGLLEAWDERVADIGATELVVTSAHARLAGTMRWPHRDPFDRLLVAQATIDGLTLVTVDDAMRDLPSPTILTW